MTKLRYVDWIILVLVLLLLVAIRSDAADFIPDTPKKVEALVMAIYLAEGGAKTNYPFGIKSIPCSNYVECKRICRNSVKNGLKRWKKSVRNGDKRGFIEHFGDRYCPPKAHKLNLNWKNNVLFFLKKR